MSSDARARIGRRLLRAVPVAERQHYVTRLGQTARLKAPVENQIEMMQTASSFKHLPSFDKTPQKSHSVTTRLEVVPLSMSEASAAVQYRYVEASRSTVVSMPNPPARPPSQFSIDGSTPIPHGSLNEDFYGGIDKRIGIVSLDFYEQMRKEHCEFCGYNFQFTSNNYNITTCPEKEWLLVTEGLGAEGSQNVTTPDNQTIFCRSLHWWHKYCP